MDGKSFNVYNVKHTKFNKQDFEKNKLTKNQIKYFIFHQASKVVIENLKKNLK